MLLKKLFKLVIDIMFPINCYGCNTAGSYLCEKCFRALRFQEYRNPLVSLERNNLDGLYFAGDYENDLLAKLIVAFKYEKIKDIGSVLSRFLNFFWQGKMTQISLVDRVLAKELEGVIVCPVPLSKKRKRMRGFNQSEILANLFCQEFCCDIFLGLRRKDRRKNQAELKKEARLKNIKDVFFCREEDAKEIRGRVVLLIDDVATTGATLNEVARVLKKLGVKKVYALALAKA